MNVSRNFLLVGTIYLVVGIGIGIYMGASGDHSLAIAHAHINLLGFTLSVLFALVYRVFPATGQSRFAGWHFWMHTVAATILLIMLVLLMSGSISEAAMVPIAPISEIVILAGILLFLANVWKNAN
jgi:hypothetical protein